MHACIQQPSSITLVRCTTRPRDGTRRALALCTRTVCTRDILSHRVVCAQLISPAIAMPAVDVQMLCCGSCPAMKDARRRKSPQVLISSDRAISRCSGYVHAMEHAVNGSEQHGGTVVRSRFSSRIVHACIPSVQRSSARETYFLAKRRYVACGLAHYMLRA